MLTHTVTFACNAKCVMCDSWKMTEKGDLTLDEIDRIYAQLPRLDVVRLTGGEPFVRKDFAEIVRLAQERLKPGIVHITTNGFLTDRIMRFCEERKKTSPLFVLVSLDGVGEKHNQVRGSSLAWRSATDTLKALAARRKELRVNLAVNQTIVDREGIEHYRLLREELGRLDVSHNLVMAYDVSATYNLEKEIDVAPTQMGEFHTFGKFDEGDLRTLLAEATKDLSRRPFFERIAKRYYLRGIRHRLLDGKGSPNPPCVALNAHLRIFPGGDVPTCQFNTKTAGNLRQSSFEEVWRSARAEELRRWVRKCPGCWAECEVLPSALYTLDILRGGPILSGGPIHRRGSGKASADDVRRVDERSGGGSNENATPEETGAAPRLSVASRELVTLESTRS